MLSTDRDRSLSLWLLCLLLAAVFGGIGPLPALPAPGNPPAKQPARPQPRPQPPAPAPEEEDNEENGNGDEEEAPEAEPPSPGIPGAVVIDDGIHATAGTGRDIELLVLLDEPEEYRSLAARLCGDPNRAEALSQANRGQRPVAGTLVRVPWALIRSEYRYLALLAIFPEDRFRRGYWEHHPQAASIPVPDEGLWQVAAWFTGDGDNWKVLGKTNRIMNPSQMGAGPVKIPAELLLKVFLPAVSGENGLLYGEDDEGAFLVHKIARGETIYSNVVLRFTDLTRPEDVNTAAEVIRQRSRIRDVRKLEVGQEVRVPIDLLALTFLPPNHPRQILARIQESEIAAIAQEPLPQPEIVPAPKPAPEQPEPTRPRASSMAGVFVVLDPGHGGADSGAKAHGIWESDYAFDVACRISRLLRQRTAAQPVLLLDDGTDQPCEPSERQKLHRNFAARLKTHPPVILRRGQTQLALNLRWYLANSIFRNLTQEQAIPPEKVVFVSLHADSLHRSARGAMIYLPGERFRRKAEGLGGASYKRFQEYREGPRVTVGRTERMRDEARSRRLASHILSAFKAGELPINDSHPIRDQIIRGRRRRAWVPAVLRGNLIPAKVLIEMVNIANAEDAALLADPAGRERIASGLVDGLARFFAAEKGGTKTREP